MGTKQRADTRNILNRFCEASPKNRGKIWLDFRLVVLLALLLASLLTGCGGASPEPPPVSQPQAGEAAESPPATELSTPAPQAESTQPDTTPPETTPSQPGNGHTEEIGVITFVEGDVFIEEATGKGLSGLMHPLAQSGRTPSALTVIRNGTRLRVEAGGSVTIVCYNNRVVRIVERRTVVMTAAVCTSEGRALPRTSAASVRPNSGTLETVNGSKRLPFQSREQEGDYGKIPIVVGPRNTAIVAGAPTIRWVEVPGVSRYKLTLNGPTPLPEQDVSGDEFTCTDTGIERIGPVCSLAWPADEWPLESGELYFLTVHARVGIEWNASESSAIEVLSAEDAQKVEAEVETIRSLGLDAPTESLLLAGLYAQEGLYENAIAAYEARLDLLPAHLIAVALGDAHRATDLQMFAFFAYQRALDLLDAGDDDPAARAGAAFGQGQVEYSFGKFAAAIPHFEAAVALASDSGQIELAEAARAALEATKEQVEMP